MKKLFLFWNLLFSLFLFADPVNFLSKPISAGKASLTENAYSVSRLLDTANFSPEFKLPVQNQNYVIQKPFFVKRLLLINRSFVNEKIREQAFPQLKFLLPTFLFLKKSRKKNYLNCSAHMYKWHHFL